MELIVTIIFSVITGCIGVIGGWSAGKNRTKRFLSFMVNRMEQLREDARVKAVKRDRSERTGNIALADRLTKELESESVIFYDVQHAISDWCVNNNEKDPFAL